MTSVKAVARDRVRWVSFAGETGPCSVTGVREARDLQRGAWVPYALQARFALAAESLLLLSESLGRPLAVASRGGVDGERLVLDEV